MPKAVDHQERRELLLAALWRIVNSRGARALSIRSVAAEAGVSKTNVVYYFPTRGHLLAGAVEQIVAATRERARSHLAGPLTVDDVVEVLMVVVPTDERRRRQAGVWKLLLLEGSDDPALSAVLDDFNDQVRDGLAAILRRLDDGGFLHASRDDEVEAARLHALVDGLSLQTLANPEWLDPPAVRDVLATHVASLAQPQPVLRP